jgi:hypothetical protein
MRTIEHRNHVVERGVHLHVATDLQARIGSRDHPVAGAEAVTNPDVFHRLSYRQVGSLRGATNRENGGGSEE